MSSDDPYPFRIAETLLRGDWSHLKYLLLFSKFNAHWPIRLYFSLER